MRIKKFQEGGMVPAEEGAPQEAPVQGGGAEEQLAQLAQQLLEMLLQQLGDPQAVMMVLQMAAEMLQQAASQQPVGAPQENTGFMRRGGKIYKCGGTIKKSKKACGGTKVSK